MNVIDMVNAKQILATQELKELLQQAMELSLSKLGEQSFVEAICTPNFSWQIKQAA
jgi:hypothetical protein